MTGEVIKNVLSEYLLKENTQNAILINGEWGSGKTFFFNEELKPFAESLDYYVVYISLNGISKVEDIGHQLFIKMIPALQKDSSGFKKRIALLTNFIGNHFSNKLFKVNVEDLIRELDFDVFTSKNYLICFDDLERCQISMKQTLGFINNYTEHKKLKVLLLSDESKIAENSDQYRNIKEKLIGRVLNFSLDTQKAISTLIEKYKTKTVFYNWLKSNQAVISHIFYQHKQNNLRTISFYLDVLEIIFPDLKNEDLIVIEECIFFSAIIVIEFKKGKLQSSDFSNYMGIPEFTKNTYDRISEERIRNVIDKKSEPKEVSKNYAETFFGEYILLKTNHYFFYPSLYEYILGGYYDSKKFKKELENRKPKSLPIHILSYQNVISWNFRELDNDVFENYIKEIIHSTKFGLYNIYQYLNIADFLFYFSKNGIIKLSNEEITGMILSGLDIAKEKNDINDYYYQEILNSKKFIDENLSPIKDVVEKIHLSMLNKEKANNVDQIIAAIKSGSSAQFQMAIEGTIFSKDILSFICVENLGNELINAKNRMVEFFDHFLGKRYDTINAGEFYYQDVEFLRNLKIDLEIKIERITKQPQRYVLDNLIGSLKEYIHKLERTKK